MSLLVANFKHKRARFFLQIRKFHQNKFQTLNFFEGNGIYLDEKKLMGKNEKPNTPFEAKNCPYLCISLTCCDSLVSANINFH